MELYEQKRKNLKPFVVTVNMGNGDVRKNEICSVGSLVAADEVVKSIAPNKNGKVCRLVSENLDKANIEVLNVNTGKISYYFYNITGRSKDDKDYEVTLIDSNRVVHRYNVFAPGQAMALLIAGYKEFNSEVYKLSTRRLNEENKNNANAKVVRLDTGEVTYFLLKVGNRIGNSIY